MTSQLNEENLIARVRSDFPELEGAYQERLQDHPEGEPLSAYEVVGWLLKPRLQQELAKGESTDFLRRSAELLECVSSTGDSEVLNVVWVKIFEWLIFRPNELEQFWPFLGPATRLRVSDAAQRWSEAARRLGNTSNLPVNNLPKSE